jgi:hypothetical protein
MSCAIRTSSGISATRPLTDRRGRLPLAGRVGRAVFRADCCLVDLITSPPPPSFGRSAPPLRRGG